MAGGVFIPVCFALSCHVRWIESTRSFDKLLRYAQVWEREGTLLHRLWSEIDHMKKPVYFLPYASRRSILQRRAEEHNWGTPQHAYNLRFYLLIPIISRRIQWVDHINYSSHTNDIATGGSLHQDSAAKAIHIALSTSPYSIFKSHTEIWVDIHESRLWRVPRLSTRCLILTSIAYSLL